MSRKNKHENDVPRRRTEQSARVSPADLKERYAFVRNRTLTGSVSSHVVSTAEQNGQLRSPRVKAHHLVDQRRRVSVILAAVALITLMLLGLVSQFTSDVVVTIQGRQLAKVDPQYAAIIDQYYGQRPIERLRFMLDTDTFTDFIQSKAPEIASASLDGSAGFARSHVVLKARRPVSGWDINGVRQYVDASGTSFLKNYYTTPGVKIIDKSGVPVQTGGPVASNRFLGFVGRLVGLTDDYGYTVKQIIIPKDTTRQIELKMKGVSFTVKCSIDRPAGEQAEDMDEAIRYLKKKGTKPRYIDVRVSGKAFYK